MTDKEIKDLDAMVLQYARLKTLIKKRNQMTEEIDKLSAALGAKIGLAPKDMHPS